jgi:transposase-like protein
MSKGQGKVGEARGKIVAELPRACSDEAAAVEFFERQRWGSEPFCARCAAIGECYQMASRTGERNARYLWRCRACKAQYTVRTGTVMEDSPIPLRHWAFAFWSASASKKGVSALQICRETGLSYKSALFMMHRIRHAMGVVPVEPLTGIVEADETYVGGRPRYSRSRRQRYSVKHPVVAVVQRGGSVRAQPMLHVTAANIQEFIKKHVDLGAATLHTDESKPYTVVGRQFAGGHSTVFHGGKEYARGNVTTNSVEGFFGLVKRSVYGTWHSVSDKHLARYVDECSFKFNTRKMDDGSRTLAAIKGSIGKRLTYKAHVGRA